MCFIREVFDYIKGLMGFCDINAQEEINEITIGPGQQMEVVELGYTGVITCISYDEFIITVNSLSKTCNSVNECYNWLCRTTKYMMEFDYHIG